MKIISVVGARPNFMKMAPVHKAFIAYNKEAASEEQSRQYPIGSRQSEKVSNSQSSVNASSKPEIVNHLVCHTGQHYDEKMSKVFFEDLELPKPDFYLGIGSGSHAEQTAKIMVEFEKVLLSEKPDLVIVYGDVNSTVACALTAVKLNIKVAHVEAGLRSGDRTMPEEINRLLTDAISDYLFVSEPNGLENLKREGIPDEKVFFVGNTMIDSLLYYLPKAFSNQYAARSNQLEETGSVPFVLVTLHRPSNVDNEENSAKLVSSLNRLTEQIKIIFPIHPRTKNNFGKWELLNKLSSNITLTDPVPYIEFIGLIKNSSMVLTDSGGIQEETTWLGVPCVTLRANTERPVTVTEGTNILIGTDIEKVIEEAKNILKGNVKKGNIPELWDGKAAERIVEVIVRNTNS